MKPCPHRIQEGTSLVETSTYILDAANTSPRNIFGSHGFSKQSVNNTSVFFSVIKIFTNTKPSPHDPGRDQS